MVLFDERSLYEVFLTFKVHENADMSLIFFFDEFLVFLGY